MVVVLPVGTDEEDRSAVWGDPPRTSQPCPPPLGTLEGGGQGRRGGPPEAIRAQRSRRLGAALPSFSANSHTAIRHVVLFLYTASADSSAAIRYLAYLVYTFHDFALFDFVLFVYTASADSSATIRYLAYLVYAVHDFALFEYVLFVFAASADSSATIRYFAYLVHLFFRDFPSLAFCAALMLDLPRGI